MRRWKRLFLFSLPVAVLVVVVALFIFQVLSNQPKSAPETASIRAVEVRLPFQALIPAYLPKRYDRSTVSIDTSLPGPEGETMLRLVYSDNRGSQVILSEWVPAHTQEAAAAGALVNPSWTQAIVDKDRLRVRVEVSPPGSLAPEQLKSVVDTLAIANKLEVYTALRSVPVVNTLPEALVIPVNADGTQEVVLVVAPEGYTPAHFSVKKGVPVRLTFKQLGQVGCGNELLFQWGQGKRADLLLESPEDSHILEFTPEQPGVYQFNCPHLVYIGAMTVTE